MYKIIESYFSVILNGEIETIWSPFQIQEKFDEPEIQIEWIQNIFVYYGLEVLHPEFCDYCLKYDTGVLFANNNWTKAVLYANTKETIETLLISALYSYLVTRRTLLFHSSLVDYEDNGIMFLGPSGVGKTTQAELWNKYTGADILNGDMVFVREKEDGFYGYGSPWHGSSPYYLNSKVKVKAMVSLEQSQKNSLRQLSGFQVMQEIMDQVFLPNWYPKAMEDCLNTLDSVLSEIPVYHLACRPDESAVMLLKKELSI